MKYKSGFQQSEDKENLFWQSWLPNSDSRATVMIVHGWAEHSSRYEHLAKSLTDHGFVVFTYDHRGHGKSGGLKAHIDRFDIYVADLHQMFSIFQAENAEKPIFLFGHSMGGLIACLFCTSKNPNIQGLILSGAALKVNENISPFLIKISGLMSLLLPKFKAVKVDTNALTRDKNIVEVALKDPLHYHGGVRARQGSEMLKASKKMYNNLSSVTQPLLILHGSADQLVEPIASQNLYDHCSSPDKTLKIYPGAYHEVINEINRNEVIGDILEWIENRI